MSGLWTLDRIFRLFLAFLVVGVSLWLLQTLSEVLIPFVLAFLIAYIINPLVTRVQKYVRSRSLAVFLTLASAALVLGLLALLVLTPVHSQMIHATQLITRAVTDVNFSEQIAHYLPAPIWNALRAQLAGDNLISLLTNESALDWATKALTKVIPSAFSLVSGTLSLLLWLAGLTMILVYLFFMLLDFDGLRKELTNLIPSSYHASAFSFLHQFDLAMSGYFRAQAFVSLINGVILATGFTIVGLPMGIVFGLFAGLLTMVPYLQLASIPLAALLVLLQSIDHGQPFWQVALFTLAVYGIMQFIEDFITVPRIVGNASGLSPVMIILALSVWGKLLGFFGLIVAIPFTCLVLAYYRKMLAERKAAESTVP